MPIFVLLFIIYGLVRAMVEVNHRAYVSSMAKPGEEAIVIGAFHTITGVLMLAANLIAGILWKYVKPEAALVFGAVVSVFAVLLFLIISKGEQEDFE